MPSKREPPSSLLSGTNFALSSFSGKIGTGVCIFEGPPRCHLSQYRHTSKSSSLLFFSYYQTVNEGIVQDFSSHSAASARMTSPHSPFSNDDTTVWTNSQNRAQISYLESGITSHSICARRVSEIQAFTIKEPYLRFTDVLLITNPKCIPKVPTQFHLNEPVVLRTFFPNPSSLAERSLL